MKVVGKKYKCWNRIERKRLERFNLWGCNDGNEFPKHIMSHSRGIWGYHFESFCFGVKLVSHEYRLFYLKVSTFWLRLNKSQFLLKILAHPLVYPSENRPPGIRNWKSVFNLTMFFSLVCKISQGMVMTKPVKKPPDISDNFQRKQHGVIKHDCRRFIEMNYLNSHPRIKFLHENCSKPRKKITTLFFIRTRKFQPTLSS